jgi:hypothetical protein
MMRDAMEGRNNGLVAEGSLDVLDLHVGVLMGWVDGDMLVVVVVGSGTIPYRGLVGEVKRSAGTDCNFLY